MQIIEHYEVPSSGQTSITFSNIPQTYTDLYLVGSLRNNGAGTFDNIDISFNGSNSGYSARLLRGTGSSPQTFTGESSELSYAFIVPTVSETANTFGNGNLYIFNYASSNPKSISYESVSEANATLAYTYLSAGLWNNSNPITSITIKSGTNFVQYSSATLYGILAGSDGTTTVS